MSLKLLFVPIALSIAGLSSVGSFNNSNLNASIIYDAGEGKFESSKVSKITKKVAYGTRWSDLLDSEKPSENPKHSNSDFTFTEYTIDGKSIPNTYRIVGDVHVVASYNPTPGTQDDWDGATWNQLASKANEGLDALKSFYPTELAKVDASKGKIAGSFIGSTKSIKYNDTDYTVRVIGENHDELADGTGYAALTFEFTELIPGFSYSNLDYCSNNWENSSLRYNLNNDFINSIEPNKNFKNNIKSVYKITNSGDGAGYKNTKKVIDKIFPLSLSEMKGDGYQYPYETPVNADYEGKQYEYYKTASTLKKSLHNQTAGYSYWTRSPETLTYSYAWNVDASGKIGNKDPLYKDINIREPSDVRLSTSVCPSFAIGRTKLDRVNLGFIENSITSSNGADSIMWTDNFNTTLSLNTYKHKLISERCDMFTVPNSGNIDAENLAIAVGYNNSDYDMTNAYRCIIPLDRVNDCTTDVGYQISNTYEIKISTPQFIWEKWNFESEGRPHTCFDGIYIVANAKIKDDITWTKIYTDSLFNKNDLETYYAPGVTKMISSTAGKIDDNHNTRIIGINEDYYNDDNNLGLTFEFYDPLKCTGWDKIEYSDSANMWSSSILKNKLQLRNSSSIVDLIESTIFDSTRQTSASKKKTVVGDGSAEINTESINAFALSPSELGISEEFYSMQKMQAKHNVVIKDEGKAYSYFDTKINGESNYYLNQLHRYRDNSDISIWLRSPSSIDQNNVFALEKYENNFNLTLKKYNSSLNVCPCFVL